MKNKKGFTLIELLVAMTIIGLLIGMTVFGISRALQQSRDTERQNFAREIQTAIVAYQGRFKRTPDITVGCGGVCVGSSTTQVYEVEYGRGTVTISTSPGQVSSTTNDQGIICYAKTTTTGNRGHAVMVYLETDEWYKITDEPCPGVPAANIAQ